MSSNKVVILSFGDDKPTKSAAPLTADEIAVYKAVLAHYSSKEAGMLSGRFLSIPNLPGTAFQREGACKAWN
jgi:hypothetical protein